MIHPELMLIPGYFEAVKHENDLRDAAMLEVPANIFGKTVQQMTLRHWLILAGVDSPFLTGKLPTPEDVVLFLWVTSPQFKPNSRFRKWLFVRSCRKIPYGPAVVKIFEFVKDTFHDKPLVFDSKGNAQYETPLVSFAASVVHSIALKFHWSKDQIMRLPIKELFQYMKLIRMREQAECGETPIKWNPSKKVKLDWLREQRCISREQKKQEEMNN